GRRRIRGQEGRAHAAPYARLRRRRLGRAPAGAVLPGDGDAGRRRHDPSPPALCVRAGPAGLLLHRGPEGLAVAGECAVVARSCCRRLLGGGGSLTRGCGAVLTVLRGPPPEGMDLSSPRPLARSLWPVPAPLAVPVLAARAARLMLALLSRPMAYPPRPQPSQR